MPAVGSSRRRISGLVRSARHTISFRFHTTGKLPYSPLAEGKKSAEIQKLFSFPFDLFSWHEIKTALIFHDLVHVHILAHGIFLRDHADLALQIRSVASKCLPVNEDFALCGQEQSGKQTDRGGLSGTVGSQQTEKFAGFYAKIQRIHSSKTVEFFCEIFCFDHLCSFPFVCMQISLYYTGKEETFQQF